MSRYDLANELSRTVARPSEEPIGLLAVITVKPVSSVEEYAARLRNLFLQVLEVSSNYDFDEDDIPTDGLPEWFLSVTDGEEAAREQGTPESAGKAGYMAARGQDPWNVEEWIYCFDPDLRAWSWWDVTEDEAGSVCVWIDTKGEAHIPCEELWWAVYAAGAEEVRPLTLENSDEWQLQVSLSAESNRSAP